MQVPRVVVVGSANMYLCILGQRIPQPGETVIGGRFVMSGGGKGANQAIAAARMGAETVFVSRLGDDLFGRQMMEQYRQEGIRCDYVYYTAAAATGVALILVDPRGENIISVASGANNGLSPDDVRRALEAVGDFQVLLLQLETPMETVLAAAETAKRRGATVILDPAPAAPLSENLLRHIDIITPNEGEASLLSGVDIADADFSRKAAERLHAIGVKNVLITLGPLGCCLAAENENRFIPAYAVEAVDSVAAGDAFNGALAYALASGKTLADAVAGTASAAAALAVTRPGAQTSLPTAGEVRRFLATTPRLTAMHPRAGK